MKMPDIRELGSILGIWAHPDDETYSMAGVFLLAKQAGQKTTCITATRGEQGVQDEIRWPKSELADIRSQEMKNVMRALGVDHHYWLDYADGNCSSEDSEEAIDKIVEIIKTHKPDTIFTFGPDGMTGHDDHKTVSSWTSVAVKKSNSDARIYHVITIRDSYEAFRQADKEMNIFFGLDKPCMCNREECDLLFELNSEILNKKMQALRLMPSQTEAILKGYDDQIRQGCSMEGFVLAGSKLEAA